MQKMVDGYCRTRLKICLFILFVVAVSKLWIDFSQYANNIRYNLVDLSSIKPLNKYYFDDHGTRDASSNLTMKNDFSAFEDDSMQISSQEVTDFQVSLSRKKVMENASSPAQESTSLINKNGKEDEKSCWDSRIIKSDKNNSESLSLAKQVHLIQQNSAGDSDANIPPRIPSNFHIEESQYCKKRNLRVIVFVHSTIDQVTRRNMTRQTWGNIMPDKIGVVFMVGNAKNKLEEAIVKKESSIYRDIVQGNYTDTYHNLIYKVLNGMYWITRNCYVVPWTFHSDNDSIVDVSYLMKFLENLDRLKIYNKLHCHIYSNSKPYRNETHKYFVSKNDYPCDTFPKFCAGGAWFTPTKNIKLIVKASANVKYIWLDDVYVSGFSAMAAGVELYNIKIFIGKEVKSADVGSTLAWLNVNKNYLSEWEKVVNGSNANLKYKFS